MTGRVVGNAIALLSSEALHRAATFAVYLLVARHLDVVAFGQLSLALTLLYVAQVTGGFGVRTLIAREVAKDAASAGSFLVHGAIVAACVSVVTLALLSAFVAVVGYAPDTATVVVLLAIAAIPYAIGSVADGVVQGLERMHLIAVVQVPMQITKVALAFVLLRSGSDLVAVVGMLVGLQVVSLALQLTIAGRLAASKGPLARPLVATALRLATRSATFMGIDASIAVWSSVPIVLLSVMRSEAEVGWFSAAAQLMVPIALVLQSVSMAVYPVMARGFVTGRTGLGEVAHATLEAMMAVAWPAAVGMFLIAPAALRLVYGDATFEVSALALRIMVVAVVFRAITSALGQVLLAGLRERVTLRIVAVNGAVMLAVGVALVPRYGVTGAAVAFTVAAVVNVVQHYAPATAIVGRVRLLGVSWRPVTASALMAAAVVGLGGANVLLDVGLGALVYAAALALLYRARLQGGLRSLAGRRVGWRRT